MGLNYKNKRFSTKGQFKAERNKSNPGRAPKVRTGRKYINGELMNSSDLNRTTVMTGLQTISNAENTSKQGRTDTTEQAAASFLNDVNIVVCQEMDENYSLLNVQTDDEVIDNPNIPFVVNKDKSASDKKVVATDKFPNADDPFYEADTNRPFTAISTQENITREITNMKSLKPAVDLINLNQSVDSGLQLKQMSVIPTQT